MIVGILKEVGREQPREGKQGGHPSRPGRERTKKQNQHGRPAQDILAASAEEGA